MGVARFPAEANTPLGVDADAVLAGAVAFEGFKPVTGRNAEGIQGGCSINEIEFIDGTGKKIC